VVELGREAAQTITFSKKKMTAFAGTPSYPTPCVGLLQKISRDLRADKNLGPEVILTPSDLDDNASVASARRAVAMFNGAGAMQSSVELEQSGSAP
jgi:hypothetical protein